MSTGLIFASIIAHVLKIQQSTVVVEHFYGRERCDLGMILSIHKSLYVKRII